VGGSRERFGGRLGDRTKRHSSKEHREGESRREQKRYLMKKSGVERPKAGDEGAIKQSGEGAGTQASKGRKKLAEWRDGQECQTDFSGNCWTGGLRKEMSV